MTLLSKCCNVISQRSMELRNGYVDVEVNNCLKQADYYTILMTLFYQLNRENFIKKSCLLKKLSAVEFALICHLKSIAFDNCKCQMRTKTLVQLGKN